MQKIVRSILIGENKWKWTVIDDPIYPMVKIYSRHKNSVYTIHADAFIGKDERLISYKVNIVPSKIKKYILEKSLV